VVAFQHIWTQSNGAENYIIALGDIAVHDAQDAQVIYAASGIDGGVSVRTAQTAELIDYAAFSKATGLPAPRQLKVIEAKDTSALIAIGQYGELIDGWEIERDGRLGAAQPFTLVGGGPGGFSDFEQLRIGTEDVFVTTSRFSNGLEVWTRDGSTLTQTGQAQSSAFLRAGSVQSLAVANPEGVPIVLAASHDQDDLLAFEVTAGGGLGSPTRLDLRDGLFIDTPTLIEVVEVAGQSFAILGSAGSNSLSVIEIFPKGQMRVTHQINDIAETHFAGVAALEVLETPAGVFVLTTGTDNGLTLMTLGTDGVLVHVGSMEDEMRAMALQNTAGLEMVWRDGGLNIYVTGKVEDTDQIGGRGITYLRVDDVADAVPQVQTGGVDHVYVGTTGIDLFRLSNSAEDQIIQDYDPDMDQLDLSQIGQIHDISDVTISHNQNGSVIQLGDAQVTVFTDDGSFLNTQDMESSDLRDLWHVDIKPLVPANSLSPVQIPWLIGAGSMDPDLLDGRGGADILLGQAPDVEFDAASAQVYRLYRAILGREPDAPGIMNWSTRLESGAQSLLEVIGGFTNSAEFAQTYGATNTTQFVTLLYNNVLGRAPDEQGFTNWCARLDDGVMSRAQVVQGFTESIEFRIETRAEALGYSRTALQVDAAADVYRLYRSTLDRDPDAQGFMNWSLRMAEGMPFIAAVSGFINSAEFTQTYGATDTTQFVTLLYNNVLGRAPDEQGFTNWCARLDDGVMSRAQVVQGFAQSQEFITAAQPDLKDWVLSLGPDDVLDGGGGANLLMGGMLSDTFVFRAAENGSHTIVDMEPWDVLRFQGFGYEDMLDVTAHLSEQESKLFFEDQGVSIVMLGTTLGDFHALELDL